MKKITCSICLLLLVFTAIAQSQDDIDKMMKQVQDAMKDVPPEAKKMMDSMGIKMPDPKKMSLPKGMTMDNIQQKQKEMVANAAAYRKKALAKMPRKIFTDGELSAFLKSSYEKIDKAVTPKAKENAQKIISESKSKNVPVENSAVFVFLKKGSQEALWIFSKLATEDPKNGNLLCNYSAVVTMCGAPDLAIPVLNSLNSKYPNNSSVLNNLGQAWYQLEKTDSAEKYLKLAIKASPNHVNANHTQARICGGRGDKAGEIICLRDALKGAYTEKIAADLKKAGVKPTRKDIIWDFPTNPDPMGLKNIRPPEYPIDVANSDLLNAKWKAFKATCKEQSAQYSAQAQKLNEIATQKDKELMLKTMKIKGYNPYILPFGEKAGIYFKPDVEDGARKTEKWFKDYVDANQQIKLFSESKSERDKKIDDELEKKYKGRCPGEGCPYNEYCPDFAAQTNKSANIYLSVVNPLINNVAEEKLEAMIISTGAAINMAVYNTVVDERLEALQATYKAAYLDIVADINYEFMSPVPTDCDDSPDKKPLGQIKLSDFDEVTCPVEDKFNLTVGIGKIAISCTKVSIEGGEGLQISYESDLRSGNDEFGIGWGWQWHTPGNSPINAEGSFKVMGIYQFDGNGNYTGGGIKINGGGQFNAGNLSTEVEHSTTYFINTGSESPGLNVGGLDWSAGAKFK